MSLHVVLGKGPVGSTLASHLIGLGHEVVVVSRSGAPTEAATERTRGSRTGTVRVHDASVHHVAADAANPSALSSVAVGAASIINAANPPYHRWPQLWPALNESAMVAAERTGATLVTASNLYGYGEGSGVMTEDTPQRSTERKGAVRAQMWRDALERHDAGRIRATEVRASDYVGPQTPGPTHAGERLFGPLLAGKTLHPVGDPNQPHAWTYLPDYVAALAAAATLEQAWGRPWLAPTNAPLSFTELATRCAAEAGVALPKIAPTSPGTLRAIGVFVPPLREVALVAYQQTAPFVVDSTLSERVLGVSATSWSEIVTRATAWWVEHLAR
ncbi:MAG: NAD-dependent epimerase/dehydratase family protein [Brevundimonas sp.]